MNKAVVLFFCFVAILFSLGCQGQLKPDPAEKKYLPVATYDPARDAEKDIQDALSEAQRSRKRVLLEVGGEWCTWCHIMDDFFKRHPELLAFRERNFVMVKINFSKENENKQVLARYPAIPGYPHLFVLDSNGTLLRSQDTSELEEGRSYNLQKLFSFLKQWAPPS